MTIRRRATRRLGLLLVALVAVGCGRLAARAAADLLAPPPASAAEMAVQAAAGASVAERQVAALQARVREAPENGALAAHLGLAFLHRARETGDPAYYPRAEQALRQALRADGASFLALRGMGELDLARHRFAEALAWGEQAHTVNPYNALALGVIADAQVELGRYDEAAATVQRMVDLRPDSSSYSRVAYIRELHGDVPGAIAAMGAAVAAAPPGSEAAAWAQVQRGLLHFNRGDLAAAEHDFAATLALRPGYLPAEAGLARLLAARGDLDAAATRYARIVASMPLPGDVATYGNLLAALGRHAEAEEQFALVAAMERLAAANGAVTDMELALFLADHGAADEAVRLARAAVTARPSIHAHDALAWALFRAGRCPEGAPHAAAALRLGTRDALLWFHSGMIAACQGQHERAREQLGIALAINPHFSLPLAAEARATLATLPRRGERPR